MPKPRKPRAKPRASKKKSESICFTNTERLALNFSAAMLDAAQKNLELVRRNLEMTIAPLRAKYPLPDAFTYDRGTGEVAPPKAGSVKEKSGG